MIAKVPGNVQDVSIDKAEKASQPDLGDMMTRDNSEVSVSAHLKAYINWHATCRKCTSEYKQIKYTCSEFKRFTRKYDLSDNMKGHLGNLSCSICA